jgi:hypothetical protein
MEKDGTEIHWICFFFICASCVGGGGRRIFVTSDTAHIFDDIYSSWPQHIVETITRQGNDVALSNSEKEKGFLI